MCASIYLHNMRKRITTLTIYSSTVGNTFYICESVVNGFRMNFLRDVEGLRAISVIQWRPQGLPNINSSVHNNSSLVNFYHAN